MEDTATSETIPGLLAARVRDLHHRPLLTAYDESTGARTELSYATAVNWAAKTANLLVEELDAQPGSTAVLDLDGHWTTVPLALACWQAGLRVMPAGPTARGPAAGSAAAGASAATSSTASGVAMSESATTETPATDDVGGAPPGLALCHTSRLDRHPAGAVVAVGDGLRAEPLEPVATRDGLVLLGEDVHVFADDFDGVEITRSTPALVTARSELDHGALVQQAAWLVDEFDGPQRIGVALPLDSAPALVTLASTVLSGGSIVASRPGGRPRWDRWTTERITGVVDHGDGSDARERGLRFGPATALDPDAHR